LFLLCMARILVVILARSRGRMPSIYARSLRAMGAFPRLTWFGVVILIDNA
jgi:hypothetical protein